MAQLVSDNVDSQNVNNESSPEISSWLSEVEELLLNSDNYLTEAPPPSQSLCDDFFADLNLPNNDTPATTPDEDDISRLFFDFSDDILDFDVENLFPQSETGVLNCDSSTPEDENSGGVRVLSPPQSQIGAEGLTPESQVRVISDGHSTSDSQIRVVNDSHSSADSQVRVLSGENSKLSDADADANDPITKKRKRQMRNRDAAVKSRERKKMYVKDLEVKTRYLEGECIRLQRMLQWVAAENQSLHLQLYNKASSASRTKQESAVLLLETLLLVSLLWFLGTMGLFPHLEMRPQLTVNVLENVDSKNQKAVDLVALGRPKSKSMGLGTLRLFYKSKRCKASRSKMKVVTCFGAVVA